MPTLNVRIIGVSSEQSRGREADVFGVQAVDGPTLAAVAMPDHSQRMSSLPPWESCVATATRST